MKTTSHVRRAIGRNLSRCFLEQFESRTLFNGNMTASVSNGVLDLQGNNLNNSVVIQEISPSTFTVSSGDGTTTINSKSTVQTFTGVNGISLNVGSGNDIVLIENATIADNIQIAGNNGNQLVTLSALTIDGNFFLTNSGGQNNTTVENSTIDGSVTVNAGAGFNSQCGSFWNCSNFSDANEIFTFSGSTVDNNLSITNTSGETTTDIENSSSIGNNLTVTNGAASYGNCGFHCDSGASASGDFLTLNGATVGNNVTVSNASDGNTTDIDNSSITGSLAVSNVVGTSAQCGFNASCSQNLANASDAFTLSGSSVGVNVTLANISDGATANIENLSFIGGSLTVNNGVGSYGQGFTSCCGQNCSNFGDLLNVSGGSTVIGNVTISNGSTYNTTNVTQGSTIVGSLSVSDGLNLTGQSQGCGGCCGGGQNVYTTDLFTLDGSTVVDNLLVSNASGYTNTAITDDSLIGNNATFINENGQAYFDMDSSSVGNNLTFTAGSGVTVVDLTNSQIGNNVTINVSTGATVVINGTTVGGDTTT
jgi:hypothetical protein